MLQLETKHATFSNVVGHPMVPSATESARPVLLSANVAPAVVLCRDVFLSVLQKPRLPSVLRSA